MVRPLLELRGAMLFPEWLADLIELATTDGAIPTGLQTVILSGTKMT